MPRSRVAVRSPVAARNVRPVAEILEDDRWILRHCARHRRAHDQSSERARRSRVLDGAVGLASALLGKLSSCATQGAAVVQLELARG